MSKKFQAPRGTRDFYPTNYKLIRWLFDSWRKVSIEHGFEEYEGPIFEYLELYEVKSGQEIAEQLFSFEDRAGRKLAIRPEITPTLARMIAERAGALKLPIKWFSIPRLCRAERPQRGRLREFFQWNIDIIGSDDVLADAECIFVALDFLQKIGLSAEEIELRVNSRTILSSLLVESNIPYEKHEHIFSIMDKYEKLSPEDFDKYATEQNLTPSELTTIKSILSANTLEEIKQLAKTEKSQVEFEKLHQLKEYLEIFNVADFFAYKPSIVRGLAYYTGIVYEIFDKSSKLRAIAGGGRYDNLIKLFNGPNLPATGFGMGDVVIIELLKDLDLLPDLSAHNRPIFFLIDADSSLFPQILKISSILRKKQIPTEFSYKRQNVTKQLKSANAKNAHFAVILGDETKSENKITIKNLDTGSQENIDLKDFLENPQLAFRIK